MSTECAVWVQCESSAGFFNCRISTAGTVDPAETASSSTTIHAPTTSATSSACTTNARNAVISSSTSAASCCRSRAGGADGSDERARTRDAATDRTVHHGTLQLEDSAEREWIVELLRTQTHLILSRERGQHIGALVAHSQSQDGGRHFARRRPETVEQNVRLHLRLRTQLGAAHTQVQVHAHVQSDRVAPVQAGQRADERGNAQRLLVQLQ